MLPLAFGLASNPSNAQTIALINKLNKKNTNETTESSSTTTSSTSSVSAGANQFEMIEVFYNSGKKFHGGFIKNSGTKANFSHSKDEFFYDIKRNDKGQIISFKTKVQVGGTYTVENHPYPTKYIGEYGKCLYFINDVAFWGSPSSSSPDIVYCSNKGDLDNYSPDKSKEVLQNYLKEAQKGVEASNAAANKIAAEKEASNRAEFTTKDKNVVAISVKASKSSLKHGESDSYIITAKLKDGKSIATNEGGYLDEYEVEVQGLPKTYIEEDGGGFGEKFTAANGTITMPYTAVVNGDKIVLKIKSKYYPSVSTTLSYQTNYEAPITLDYNGIKQYRKAVPLKIEYKGVKNALTGKDLLEVKISHLESGKLYRHFKMAPTAALNIQTNGVKGWTGTPGKTGTYGPKDGGDGGNVKVIIDPSVKSYTLNISQRGGASGGMYSNAGRDGTTEKIKQKVSW